MKRFLLVLALLLPLANTARADEFEPYRKCLLKVSAETLEAKIEFQTGLADLISAESPDLGALAALSRDLQIALAKARHTNLDYLIREDLPRLVSASGLIRFLNFDWQPEDEAALQAEDETYVALLDQIKVLGEESNANETWPELRERFINIQEGKDFQKILERFNDRQAKTEKRLENC